MNNILIVEDNHSQAALLQNAIKKSYPDWNLDLADTLVSALDMIEGSLHNGKPYTLFLLDVQLSKNPEDRSGFVIAEEIRNTALYYQVPILFLTVVSDESYFALSQFHCYNYIKKPYTPADIIAQINHMLLTGYLHNLISITDIYRVCHHINKSDIQYVEAQSHTIKMCTVHGKIVTREYSLNALPDILGNDFLRCHKRYIINKNYIVNYDKQLSMAELAQEIHIPVGNAYSDIMSHYALQM